jgi:hypothetical protein
MVDVTEDAMAEDQLEIHRAIQGHGPTPDATCLGWTLVAEFQGEDGRRFLGRISSAETPLWQIRGYLHESLHGEWLDRAWPGEWEGN